MRRTGQYHFLNQGGAGDVDIDEEGVVIGRRHLGGRHRRRRQGHLPGRDARPVEGLEPGQPPHRPGHRTGRPAERRCRGPVERAVPQHLHRPARARCPACASARATSSGRERSTWPATARRPRTPSRPARPARRSPIHRYEPVASPVVVYRDVPAAPDDPGLHHGDTAEILVIRSENGASLDSAAGASRRHLLPPKVAQGFAELHGVLDTGAGGALDKTVYDHVAALDAGDLANHPDGVDDPTTPGSKAFPVDHLDLNYLPDPLARAAVLRDLPPGGSPATDQHADADVPGGWPDYETWRVDLVGGPTSRWDIDNTNRGADHHAGQGRRVRATAVVGPDFAPIST